MLFNSFQYWIFFLIVAVLFYSMPFRIGKLLLLCASYVFYMWWDPRFIVLILTSTVVDYFLGIWLEVTTGRRKKLLLAISLVVNLGILGFFKYYDFFAGSLAGLLHIPKSSVVLQIVLPVGVSFYSFASLSLAASAGDHDSERYHSCYIWSVKKDGFCRSFLGRVRLVL